MNPTIKSVFIPPSIVAANVAASNGFLRNLTLKTIEKKIYTYLMGKNVDVIPKRAREDKYHVLNNMLHSIDRALSDNRISAEVRHGLVKVLVGKILLGDNGKKRAFEDVHSHKPPLFLTQGLSYRMN